jgi:hypothetical protein
LGLVIALVVGLALAGAVAADDEIPVVSKVIAFVWIPALFTSPILGPMLLGSPTRSYG